MGEPVTPIPPHLYPEAIQLKLYQAFIFSIPILFSIILFLLFYLFYLKKRASNLSSSPSPMLPVTSNYQAASYSPSLCQIVTYKELKEKLPVVVFDERLRTRDSQCCVCLGEFEIKEELLQVPSCKHIFHVECIHLWLHTNSNCPLCRCSVVSCPKISFATDNNNSLVEQTSEPSVDDVSSRNDETGNLDDQNSVDDVSSRNNNTDNFDDQEHVDHVSSRNNETGNFDE